MDGSKRERSGVHFSDILGYPLPLKLTQTQKLSKWRPQVLLELSVGVCLFNLADTDALLMTQLIWESPRFPQPAPAPSQNTVSLLDAPLSDFFCPGPYYIILKKSITGEVFLLPLCMHFLMGRTKPCLSCLLHDQHRACLYNKLRGNFHWMVKYCFKNPTGPS